MIPHHAWVVLIRDDGTQAIIRASKNAEVRSGNMRARGDQLVGHPYGSTFEFHEMDEPDDLITRGPEKSLQKLNEKRAKKRKAPVKYSKLVRVEATADAFAILRQATPVGEGEQSDAAEGQTALGEEDQRDNRGYQANPDNQKADSIGLRNSGASGADIVRALTENSSTFAMKNKFSQEKYLRRIMQKHVPRVTVVRATSRTVAEVLFLKHEPTMATDTIRSMRWVDALPQMIAFGNVHAAAKCLVLDGIGGLLSLAVLERLREDRGGRCYFVGTTPREITGGGGRPFIDLLNIPKNVLVSRFAVCPSNRLKNGAVIEGTVNENLDDGEDEEEQGAEMDVLMKEVNQENHDEQGAAEDQKVEGEEESQKDSANDESFAQTSSSQPSMKRARRVRTVEDIVQMRELRKARQEEMFTVLNTSTGECGADSLLIAARHDPVEALEVLLPHLGLGRPFVVHHPCFEPLMVAKAKLADSKACLDLTVTEAFCREYQVLPERTHPHMTGSATGGFILRGIKVQPWGE